MVSRMWLHCGAEKRVAMSSCWKRTTSPRRLRVGDSSPVFGTMSDNKQL